jgi:hypothetical protein
MMHTAQNVLLSAAMLAAGSAAWAHHSNVAVDMTRRATVEGTVKTLEWTNPHVWLWIESEGGDQRARTFAFESSSPSELARFFGWTKRSVAAGDRVTVEYAPFRNGEPGGALVNLTLADGRAIRTPNSTRRPAAAR